LFCIELVRVPGKEVLISLVHAKTYNVKIGSKGKRVKMARWWDRLGGKTVSHVASPRLS